LREILARAEGLSADGFAGSLVDDLRSWSGHVADNQPFEDDLTIVVVDFHRGSATMEIN
jgi:hypothetical protein